MRTYNPAKTLLLALSLLGLPCTASSADIDGRWIMEQVDGRDDGDSQTSDTTMTLIDRNGNERVRRIKMFSKDQGKDTQRLQFFLSPADVKDTGFLTYDYYSGATDDDQWLYLPDLRRTKRIATSDKSSSFMGSDFSYADMTRRVLDEWNYTLLKEDMVGEHMVWLVEAVPVSEEVVERYGYTKSIVFVRQDNFMVIRAIHVLSEGGRVKYMEVNELREIDDIWVATEISMKTTKNKRVLHSTLLQLENITFNQEIDDDLFTVRRLEKGL
jgi:outer membrane lipoprotein-sorting protein